MNKLIAFTGLATSGKTTAANHLVYAYGFVRVSFATPIKEMISCLGLETHDLTVGKNEPHPNLNGKTPRYALQMLGTEFGRRYLGDNIWVDTTARGIKALREFGIDVVIDDCRFSNEAEMVRSLGGEIIQIIRPGLVAMNHESERGIDANLVDAVIHNIGDIDDLIQNVEAVVK